MPTAPGYTLGPYGAISKAIGESFEGLSGGAMAGEEIRHKRASEALQQGYLREVLMRGSLAERAQAARDLYQQGLLGWHMQTAQQQAARDQMRDAQQAATLEANQQRWENQDAAARQRDATTNRRIDFYEGKAIEDREARLSMDKENRAERARESNQRIGLQWAEYATRANRAAAYIKRLGSSGGAMSPEFRIKLESLKTEHAKLMQNIRLGHTDINMGRQPAIPLAQLEMELSRVEQAIENLGAVAGGGEAAPPKLDTAGIARKWNLK
jgi:hypothetical protein